MTKHNIEPVYNQDSRILILGSFPSVKSREAKFFYHHPQNRFWKVLAALFQEEVPQAIEEKKTFLLRNHLALWDVIESCDIVGSSDSSISNVVPVDISQILSRANIIKVYANGGKAFELYNKTMVSPIQDDITRCFDKIYQTEKSITFVPFKLETEEVAQ